MQQNEERDILHLLGMTAMVYSKQIQAIEKGEIHGKTLPQT